MGKSAVAADLQAAAQAAGLIRKTRQDLTTRRSALAAEIDALNRRNAYVAALPLNRNDGKQFVVDCVDTIAAQFVSRTRYPQFIEMVFATPQRSSSLGQVDGRSDRPLALEDVVAVREKGWAVLGAGAKHFFAGMVDWNNQTIEADAMCFFFGEALKKKLEANLDDWFPDYAENKNRMVRRKDHQHYETATEVELASSLDERLAEIRSNQVKIDRLEHECDELDEALASLGTAAEESGQ